MGKIKTTIFLVVGLFFTFSMIPNYMLGEHPVIGPYIMLMGISITLLPIINRPLKLVLGKFYNTVSRTAYIMLFAGLAFMLFLTIVMVSAAQEINIPSGADVIIPGCAIIYDKPRPMLQNRLDTAYSYLINHSSARCVVTGGQFGIYTQAEIMKKVLVEKGIDESRIIVDDKSDNTSTNMINAHLLLGESENVVIVTDAYHQLRAKKFASEQGLKPYALASPTPLNHYVDSWLREYIGVIKAYAIDQ